MPESFYNQVTARHSVEGAKVWLTANPASPYSWCYKQVVKRLPEINGCYIHFTMDDNPSLSDEVKERYKRLYTGVWYKRYILGQWVAADGLIYDMFRTEVNVIDYADIPFEDALDFYIGVDYGTGNATAFELFMTTYSDEIYVIKEYYFMGRKEAEESGNYDSQKTDLEFANDLRQFIYDNRLLLQGKTYRDIPVVVDPAAASFKLQLRRFHFKTKNANNDVISGIRTCATLFGNGKLKISRECQNLIEEIHTYHWDSKAQERGLDKPEKVQDHACDALRYGVMEIKRKGRLGQVGYHVSI